MKKQMSVRSKEFSKGVRRCLFSCFGAGSDSTPLMDLSRHQNGSLLNLTTVYSLSPLEVTASLNSPPPAEAVADVSRLSRLSRSISVQFKQDGVKLGLGSSIYRLSDELRKRLSTLDLMFEGTPTCESTQVFKLDAGALPHYETLEQLLRRCMQGKSEDSLIGMQDFEEALKGDMSENAKAPELVIKLYKALNYFSYETSILVKELERLSGINMTISENTASLNISNHFTNSADFTDVQRLELFKQLSAFLKEEGCLISLNFNSIPFQEIRVILEQSFDCLEGLFIRSQGINVNKLQNLLPLLSTLTVLTDLDLSNNQLGAAGARSLAVVLSALTGLQSLNLSENEIRAEGARSLSGVLSFLTGLQSLGLWANNLSAEATVLLRTQLTQIPNLTL